MSVSRRVAVALAGSAVVSVILVGCSDDAPQGTAPSATPSLIDISPDEKIVAPSESAQVDTGRVAISVDRTIDQPPSSDVGYGPSVVDAGEPAATPEEEYTVVSEEIVKEEITSSTYTPVDVSSDGTPPPLDEKLTPDPAADDFHNHDVVLPESGVMPKLPVFPELTLLRDRSRVNGNDSYLAFSTDLAWQEVTSRVREQFEADGWELQWAFPSPGDAFDSVYEFAYVRDGVRAAGTTIVADGKVSVVLQVDKETGSESRSK